MVIRQGQIQDLDKGGGGGSQAQTGAESTPCKGGGGGIQGHVLLETFEI